MKRQSKIVIYSLSSLLALGVVSLNCFKKSVKEQEPDNVTYDEDLSVDYNQPDQIYNAKKADSTVVNKVIIHFHDDDGEIIKNGELNRAFWFWCSGWAPAKEYYPDEGYTANDLSITLDFTSEEFSGAYKKSSLSFIIKNKSTDPLAPTWTWQTSNTELIYEDQVINNGVCEVWTAITQGRDLGVYESEEKSKMTGIKLAYFSDWKNIQVTNTATEGVHYKIYAYGRTNLLTITHSEQEKKYCLFKEGEGSGESFTIALNNIIRPNVQYVIESNAIGKEDDIKYCYVTFERLYKTDRFVTYYNYDGDLGCFYSKEETTFRVWAPTTGLVRVLLYSTGTPSDFAGGSNDYRSYRMNYRPGGVWELTIKNKDLANTYYCYQTINSSGKNTVVDPYATACGINGVRGMIYDKSTTNPTGWDDVPEVWDKVEGYDITTPQDLSIYEVHVRDLTADETWTSNKNNARGTFNAFSEAGTTYTDGETTVTTGYDHIEEMGVKAIQLLPVFDSDNSENSEDNTYNWGYNPLNYNCVEGAYSTNPYVGTTRIKEFKNLVMSYANNANHTRTIMDVVFNHVNSASDSNFNKIVPKYYFRFDDTFTYFQDGSGCGNEVKSEAPMMRKFIVDSLCMWAKEYKIKGFRFDLMGLLDTDTLNLAKKELYKIDPDIYIYGEGWTAGGYHGDADSYSADSSNVYSKCYDTTDAIYLGCFNDAGRNALKGENDLSNAWGFISQGSDYVGSKSSTVADMMVGYHTGKGGNPAQCLNYASCHDNFTLFDQFTYTLAQDGAGDYPGMACAGVSATECSVLFSNGVAFIQGGEELFRSKEVSDYDYEHTSNCKNNTVTINGKKISHNSYNLSDYTNAFKWDRKISVEGVKTLDYVQEIEKAVALRNKLTKYSYSDLQKNNPYSSSSPMNVWNQGDGSTCIGMKNNEYFFFVAGCNSSNISFAAYDSEGYNKQVFCSNPKSGGFSHPETGYIKLGWATCVCLTK